MRKRRGSVTAVKNERRGKKMRRNVREEKEGGGRRERKMCQWRTGGRRRETEVKVTRRRKIKGEEN